MAWLWCARRWIIFTARFSFAYGAEPGRLPETPPPIVIEILSADGRFAAVCGKLERYRAWGVPNVWLIDQDSRRFYTFGTALSEAPLFEIPELGIAITPRELFD